jgi:hypothetical protein
MYFKAECILLLVYIKLHYVSTLLNTNTDYVTSASGDQPHRKLRICESVGSHCICNFQSENVLSWSLWIIATATFTEPSDDSQHLALLDRETRSYTLTFRQGNLRTCAGPAGSVEPWAVCRYTCVYSVSCTRAIAFLNSLTVVFTIITCNCAALLRLKGNREILSKSTLALGGAHFECAWYDNCNNKFEVLWNWQFVCALFVANLFVSTSHWNSHCPSVFKYCFF